MKRYGSEYGGYMVTDGYGYRCIYDNGNEYTYELIP